MVNIKTVPGISVITPLKHHLSNISFSNNAVKDQVTGDYDHSLWVFVHYLVKCGHRCVTLHSVALELQGLSMVSDPQVLSAWFRKQLLNIPRVSICNNPSPIYFFLKLNKY